MSHTPRLGVYIDSRTVLTGAEDVQSATSSALGDAGADAQLCQSVREHLKGDICHAYTATGTLGDGQRRIAGVPSLHHIGADDDALRQDLAIGAPWGRFGWFAEAAASVYGFTASSPLVRKGGAGSASRRAFQRCLRDPLIRTESKVMAERLGENSPASLRGVATVLGLRAPYTVSMLYTHSTQDMCIKHSVSCTIM